MSGTITFHYTAKLELTNPAHLDTPQSWEVEAVVTPSGPIHDVASAMSLSGQVNLKTHWKTTEELNIYIPKITPAEYAKARECLFSIHSQEFTIDMQSEPFIAADVDCKLKTSAIALTPASTRSHFRSARFVVEPVI